jgi:hypothetical protein
MDELKVKIKDFKNAKPCDILTFDGKQWVPSTLEEVLSILIKKIEELDDRINQIGINTYGKVLLFEEVLQQQRQQIADILKGLVK